MSRKNNAVSRLFAVLAAALIAVLFSGFFTGTSAVKAADSDFKIESGRLTSYNGSAKVVTVPKGVTSIARFCFAEKSGIEEIVLPKSVKRIETYAFRGCSVKKINFPDSLTEIDPDAFYGCTSLEKASFGKNLKSIGSAAFDGCTSLSSVTFGSKLNSIGDYAFSKCESLKAVKIPASVEKIGYMAFYNCTALKSVTIPKKNKIKNIGVDAFTGTGWLDALEYDKNGFRMYRGIIFGAKNKEGVLSIPSGTKVIAGAAFCYNYYTEIKFPESLISISDRAFVSSYYLEKVTIPSNVKYVFDYAFSNSNYIKSIKLHDGFEYFGWNVFNPATVDATKVTDTLCREIYEKIREGRCVEIILPDSCKELNGKEKDAYVQEIFNRISKLYGFGVAVSSSDYSINSYYVVTSSSYPDGSARCKVSPSPFFTLKKVSDEILKDIETVTIKNYSDAEITRLDSQLKKGKSLVLKYKASSKKADEKLKKINKMLQKKNKAGVILTSSGVSNAVTVNGVDYQPVTGVKSGYTSIYISEVNAKTYTYAVELINKLFDKAKRNAKSDSNHDSSFANAKSVLSKAGSMSELSDAMKVYAIAVTRYFAGSGSSNSMNMVYSNKYAYTYVKEENNAVRMKKLLDGKAAGVCEDFAYYENLLFSQMGIENWYNDSYALNHAWSVVKVTNSEGKTMYVPFDYDIGPHPRLSGFYYNANDEKQVAERYKIYLDGIPGASAKKNFSNSDFK